MSVTASPVIPRPRRQSRSAHPDPGALPNEPRHRSAPGKSAFSWLKITLQPPGPCKLCSNCVATRLSSRLDLRRSALELAPKIEFDVLVCDLNLPDGTGWELLVKLGEKGRECAIAYSAFDEPQHLARSRQAGFVEHLAKGTDADELLAAIQRIARGKRRIAEPGAPRSRRSQPRPPRNRTS